MIYPNEEISTELEVHHLENKHGFKVSVTNFGGRIISILAPDRWGNLRDVVLGYDSVEQYLHGNPYFGSIIGRFGNRIAQGKFSLDGRDYHLTINNRSNALHGGQAGFHNQFWKIKSLYKDGSSALELSYISKDGEEGYPGTLHVTVYYIVTDENELIMEYQAVTDKTTVINLTHHSFFNLAGEGNGSIQDHTLMINADSFTPVDPELIPIGEIRNVEGTAFDFRQPRRIGERINDWEDQLACGSGYDHNWVLNKEEDSLSMAAKVIEPESGRILEIWTTEPGLQFYAGNFLDGSDMGKAGKHYEYRSAFCLEPQHFPDSPNQKHFPSVVLNPGEQYKQKTIYRFGVSD